MSEVELIQGRRAEGRANGTAEADIRRNRPVEGVLVGARGAVAVIVRVTTRRRQVQGPDERQVLDDRDLKFGEDFLHRVRTRRVASCGLAPEVASLSLRIWRVVDLVMTVARADGPLQRPGRQVVQRTGDDRFTDILFVGRRAVGLEEQEVVLRLGELTRDDPLAQPRNTARRQAGAAEVREVGCRRVTGRGRCRRCEHAVVVDGVKRVIGVRLRIGRRHIVVEPVEPSQVLEVTLQADDGAKVLHILSIV